MSKAVPFLIKFNKDEVFTRCIPCKTVGDIFAADVMYHKNCNTNYVVKFQRDVREVLDDNDDQCNNSIIREPSNFNNWCQSKWRKSLTRKSL